jgi:oligopeptide/dipeptide ABC transporter ATP-binding protein
MTALLEISGLGLSSPPRNLREWLRRRTGRAALGLNALSLSLERGDSLAIVGEEGCGKNRLARALLKLTDIGTGDIHFDGQSVRGLRGAALASFRRRVQILARGTVASLNPRLTVAETLAEPLNVHRIVPRREIPARVDALLTQVGLSPTLHRARAARLSPGDCQRVAIARALSVGPELLVANDPLAGLDLSIQAQIVNLLADLQHQLNLTLIFIASDLRAASHLCRSAAIMYFGRVVEQGPIEEILRRPRHPYTQALLASTPKMRADAPAPVAALAGEPPCTAELPPGCAFHQRCRKVKAICRAGLPPVRRQDGPVTVWCHLYPEGAAVTR